ncbi:MAG: hypothetical protein FMNOHCHN_03744 [Ignavibacteriaceae bacterium]|nr:hypothetical protein [Ignavibacteriaceae bacterium]
MKSSLGKKSWNKLKTCDERLQKLVEEVSKRMDITVLCGFRGEEDQNKAFAEKKSKLQFPDSKHNKLPSLAVDIAPYPIDWNDIKQFEAMCDLVEDTAHDLGIKIRLGRDFSFKDYPHVELIDG